ncbi:hypothetical protein [Kingella potus]|uniref:hypothetical protein n=1 Tax=Kingella potus TaxID=265175 RepID=UPI001FD62F04|nr:hypothetical protein [Kingella potus]UOP01148.1 hypothetical protein LVJ84_02170 [Kingella potus]
MYCLRAEHPPERQRPSENANGISDAPNPYVQTAFPVLQTSVKSNDAHICNRVRRFGGAPYFGNRGRPNHLFRRPAAFSVPNPA